MGLISYFKSIIVRNKVMNGLRANCPEGVKNELETLLADKAATNNVKTFIMEAIKAGGKIRPDALLNLPFSESMQKLLADTPKLVTYLALAARMAGKK